MIFAWARSRWPSALAAALTVPLGLLTRSGLPMPAPIAAYGGDTLYATLIVFLIGVLWPQGSAWRIGLLALGLCCAIELSQLYHAPWLDGLRATRPGRLVLGAGFRWDDLACYGVGALLGGLIYARWLSRGTPRTP